MGVPSTSLPSTEYETRILYPVRKKAGAEAGAASEGQLGVGKEGERGGGLLLGPFEQPWSDWCNTSSVNPQRSRGPPNRVAVGLVLSFPTRRAFLPMRHAGCAQGSRGSSALLQPWSAPDRPKQALSPLTTPPRPSPFLPSPRLTPTPDAKKTRLKTPPLHLKPLLKAGRKAPPHAKQDTYCTMAGCVFVHRDMHMR